MKYLLQIYPDTDEFVGLSAHEQEAIVEEYLAIERSPGVVGGHRLKPVETATTVRVRDGETLLTDGPFVDAKEHLGGSSPSEGFRQEKIPVNRGIFVVRISIAEYLPAALGCPVASRLDPKTAC